MKRETPRQKLISEMSVIQRVLGEEKAYPRPNPVSIVKLQVAFETKAIELANMEIQKYRKRLGSQL